MKVNMGTFDRTFRLSIAGLIAVLFFMQYITGTLAITLLVVAGILFITGLIGICPLYSLLGINSCSRKSSNKIE